MSLSDDTVRDDLAPAPLPAAGAPATTSPPPGVRVDRLVVKTKAGFALDIQDLSLAAGETVAVVGANGAGKTTLLEALLGLRKTEVAEGSIGEASLQAWARSPRLRRRMGVMLQRTALPFGLRVRDVLDLHRRIYGSQAQAVLETLDVVRMRDFNYDWLSRGQRQRVDLVMALAHRPDLILLDEPFTGLDQQFATATHHLLSGMSSATVLLACHSAHELSLADRMLWMRDGRVAAFAPPGALIKDMLGEYALKVSLYDAASAERLRARAQGAVRRIHAPRPDQLHLFGGSDLETLAHALIGEAAIASVEFGAASYTDLLHVCALGDAHA
jgi:ABC-2 type transport system ATP-binding protein